MDYYATIDTCIRELFIYPLILLLIFAGCLCREIWLLIRIIRKKIIVSSNFPVLLKIYSIVIISAFLWIDCHLLKQGFYLPFEKNRQAVFDTGTVEFIKRDRFSPRLYPATDSDFSHTTYSFGGKIVIDGESYYCLSTRGWQKGDVVSFSFLPKSRIILQLEKQNQSGDGSMIGGSIGEPSPD